MLAILVASAGPALAQTVSSVQLKLFEQGDGGPYHMTIDPIEIGNLFAIQHWSGRGDATLLFVFPRPAGGTVPLYRYRHATSGDHFFTTSLDEGNQAIARFGYISEGVCCHIAATHLPGTTPLYRIRKGAQHQYLNSRGQRDWALTREGFVDEGIVGYVWTEPLRLPTPCAGATRRGGC